MFLTYRSHIIIIIQVDIFCKINTLRRLSVLHLRYSHVHINPNSVLVTNYTKLYLSIKAFIVM